MAWRGAHLAVVRGQDLSFDSTAGVRAWRFRPRMVGPRECKTIAPWASVLRCWHLHFSCLRQTCEKILANPRDRIARGRLVEVEALEGVDQDSCDLAAPELNYLPHVGTKNPSSPLHC